MVTSTPITSPEFVSQILKMVLASTVQSGARIFWTIIKTMWSSYWLYILIFLIGWVPWELITRNGGFHYNSENGFSPTFNRVVGSGVYLLFQGGVYAVINKIFGNEAYSHIWPYSIHLIVFLSTGLFLNLVGFWKYWKLPRV